MLFRSIEDAVDGSVGDAVDGLVGDAVDGSVGDAVDGPGGRVPPSHSGTFAAVSHIKRSTLKYGKSG